jgi:hypothetical protein
MLLVTGACGQWLTAIAKTFKLQQKPLSITSIAFINGRILKTDPPMLLLIEIHEFRQVVRKYIGLSNKPIRVLIGLILKELHAFKISSSSSLSFIEKKPRASGFDPTTL